MADRLELTLNANAVSAHSADDAELRFNDGTGQLVTVFTSLKTSASSETHSASSGAVYVHEMVLTGAVEVVLETPLGDSSQAEREFSCSLGEIVAGGIVAADATRLTEAVSDACADLTAKLGRDDYECCEIDINALGDFVASIAK